MGLTFGTTQLLPCRWSTPGHWPGALPSGTSETLPSRQAWDSIWPLHTCTLSQERPGTPPMCSASRVQTCRQGSGRAWAAESRRRCQGRRGGPSLEWACRSTAPLAEALQVQHTSGRAALQMRQAGRSGRLACAVSLATTACAAHVVARPGSCCAAQPVAIVLALGWGTVSSSVHAWEARRSACHPSLGRYQRHSEGCSPKGGGSPVRGPLRT